MKSQRDIFKGITFTITNLEYTVETFQKDFSKKLQNEQKKKTRGVWIQIPIALSILIPVLVNEFKFEFHHAKPTYLMLTRWLPTEEKNLLYNGPFSLVGVGGLIINSDNQVLLIKEKYTRNAKTQKYKLPGGLIDQGESLAVAAVREVREEIGVETEAISLVSWFRHTQNLKHRFGLSDIYFVVRLKLLSESLSIDKNEIKIAEWIDLDQVLDKSWEDIYPMHREIITIATNGKQKDLSLNSLYNTVQYISSSYTNKK
ncbi:hypothetical protein M0813_28380 [Anaeramoeba flamelloides]|uniref:Nudix hydrolase domain-containing protein n=1 Tax=Anaeramoeba flamelloides TaxID=1746091 RepID=A0ABQ8XUH7_9EUKA|nr:hypothetical protein M0813_28380 [Anaeramoeba flamelloides]